MNTSIFQVSGPIMIGPSSSHTAGAARLARVAAVIAAKPFYKVSFGLHGSFAQTYKGHGTDKALVAGALGIAEDDEDLVRAFEIARERGLEYSFYEAVLEHVHENTVQIRFFMEDGSQCEIIGSSIGGGQIEIGRINGYEVQYSAASPALFVWHNDCVGVISDITRVLSEKHVNIAVMKLNRKSKGGDAFCLIESDEFLPQDAVDAIAALPHIHAVQAVNAGISYG